MHGLLFHKAFVPPDFFRWSHQVQSPQIKQPVEAFVANLSQVHALWYILPDVIEKGYIQAYLESRAMFNLTGNPVMAAERKNDTEFLKKVDQEIRRIALEENMRTLKEMEQQSDPDWSVKLHLNHSLYMLDGLFAQGDGSILTGGASVLRAMILQTWTAFEVLAHDLWFRVTEARTHLVTDLSKTKQKDIGFRSLRRIRWSYEWVFTPDAGKIMEALNPTTNDALAAYRNVLVHAGGKVDSVFKDKDVPKIPELSHLAALEINKYVPLDGNVVNSLITPVFDNGHKLMEAVDNWILTHP